MTPRVLFVTLVVLGGCGGEESLSADDAGAESSSNGSSSPPAEDLVLEPAFFIQENSPLTLIESGERVGISQAVQGGQVIYIAGQLQHLEGDMAYIQTSLTDLDTGEVRAQDERTVVVKDVPDREGWKQPDLRSRNQVSHLLVCPSDSTRPLVDTAWQLDITMAEADKSRSASVTLEVVPSCNQGNSTQQDLCESQCAPAVGGDQ